MPPPADRPGPGSTRHLPRWLLIAAGAVLVARIGSGVYEERHPPEAAELVRWQPLDRAVAASRLTGKPILYDFTADWCPPCRVMQREVFSEPRAAAQIEALFVPVRVLDRQREDGRNNAEVDSLQKHYRVDGFPTLVVAPLRGEPTTLVGYNGRDGTIQALTRAAMKGMMPGALPKQGP